MKPSPNLDNACAQCGKARPVTITLTHDKKSWLLCSTCWREGMRPWNAKPPLEATLPAIGTVAGVLPSTGETMLYTGEIFDLKTGQRRPLAPDERSR